MKEIIFKDFSAEQKNPPPQKTLANGTKSNLCKLSKGKVVIRDPKTIDGITVHQTACVFGPSNNLEKRHRRCLDVPSQALAFRDGVVGIGWPLLWFTHTSNGLNDRSLGLEIEGEYAGLEDDPTTIAREDIKSMWKNKEPTPFDDLAIETARAAFKYLYDKGLETGCPLKYVWGHRQSNGSKPSDPGALIWKHIVLDYAVKVLGMETMPAFTNRDGKPIPQAWAPNGVGKY